MVEKFKIAQHGKNDRNIKASVEQIKQQTYINNIENKTKINELIDETNKIDISGTTAETISLNGTSLLDMFYPIGSLYWSKNSTNPGTLFGGTWTRIKDMFVLASGDDYANDTTGGEAEHTLTIDEMPSHTHKVRYVGDNAGGIYGGQPGTSTDASPEYNTYFIANEGGDEAHNNMPPYITRYCWERTN